MVTTPPILSRVLPVVDAAWVAAHRDEVVLADVRWYLDGRSGRAAYAGGHLPGAVFVDLDADLAAPPGPAAFAATMGRLGIGDADTVVAYDDAGGVVAARLVWMLRATGHPAALLDGGIAAWDGPLETASSARPSAVFTAAPWPPERLAAAEDAADAVNVVLDARASERYAGIEEPVDPRAGHIPGARSVPCRENVGPDGRLLPVEALRRRLAAAGVDAATPVVSYCGSGVNACHTLLVLEHAGLGPGRLYPGSWSEWSADAARPAETGGDARR